MRTSLALRLLGFAALLSTGCELTRGGGGGAGQTGGGADGGPATTTRTDAGPPPSLGATIYDLQDSSRTATFKPPGSAVVVSAVVTAVSPPSNGRYRLFVEDRAGGAYSGIYVYNYLGSPPAAGDIVTVEGTVEEFPRPAPGQTLSTYETTTQLVNPKITVTGHDESAIPAPAQVTAADLSAAETAEKWEGVLVEVKEVKVTSANPNAPQDFGEFLAAPASGSPGTIRVNDTFRHSYADRRKVGDVFKSIIGVIQFEFGSYKLDPRSNLDLTFADDTHPEPISAAVTTIEQIQDRSRTDAVAPNALVTITGVYVTAVKPAPEGSSGSRTFWVQDATRPGPYSGIEVFKPSSVTVAVPAEGDWVTLEGRYQEYPSTGSGGVSQVVISKVSPGTAGTVPPTAQEVTVKQLTDAASDRTDFWEGVLVRVRGARATSPPDYSGFTIKDSTGKSIKVWNGVFAYDASKDQFFDSITGVVAVYSSAFQLAPRKQADLVGTSGEVCGDGIDNDVDLLVDCADPDCGGSCVVTAVPIRRIQDPSAPDKIAQLSQVRVEGTVTGVLPASNRFYMQDATSEWSGIQVYIPYDSRSDIDIRAVAAGDVVRVEGVYKEYHPPSSTVYPTMSQIEARLLTRLSSGNPAAPVTVSPRVLGTRATGEAWEAMLVRVASPEVKALYDHNEYALAADGGTARADDEFRPLIHYYFETSDTEVLFTPKVGQRFASVTGILNDAFGDHKIEPRSLADFVGVAEQCDDRIENDLDGRYDCNDPDCGADPSCGVSTVSIGALQAATPTIPDGYTVRLENVYVSARDASTDKNGNFKAGYFWVQSAPSAAAREGIAVFVEEDAAAIAQRGQLQVGKKVSVAGLYQQDYTGGGASGVTRLLVNTGLPYHELLVSADGPVGLTPVVVGAATLGVRATAEAYEGVYVEVQGVLAAESSARTVLRTDAQSEGPTLSTRLYATSPSAGQRYSSVRGVLHDAAGVYELVTRGAGDFSGVAEICGNGIDDDLLGTRDCADTACATVPLCTNLVTVTLPQVHDGDLDPAVGQRIRVENLRVTARSAVFSRSFWAQTNDGSSERSGIFVFSPSAGGIPSGPAIGTVLNVEGYLAQFTALYGTGTVTEILVQAPDGKTEPNGTTALAVVPRSFTVEELADPATAEKMEGMLVELGCVEVQALETCTESCSSSNNCFPSFWVRPTDRSVPVPVKVGSLAYRSACWASVPKAVGTRFGSLAGVLHQDRGQYSVLPRGGQGDTDTDASGCP